VGSGTGAHGGFFKRLPGGNYLLEALARIDLILWPPDLGQKDLVREDLQVLAQEDKENLVREEYFSAILRKYSPLARRNLRRLMITGNPKSVLEEEWEQYFQDGIVEGGVRPELRDLIRRLLVIRRLLDEFQDTP
jgi:hypothetical protein